MVGRDGKRFTSVESTLQMWTRQFVMGSGRHARQECGQDALEKKVREVRTEVVAGNLVRIGYLRRRFCELSWNRNIAGLTPFSSYSIFNENNRFGLYTTFCE
jgi:hypothetical protein